MAHYLAIDVGSTTVTALAIDVEMRAVVGAASAANAAETTAAEDKRRGRSEWDLERMVGLAVDNAAGLVADTGVVPAAIGVTGQQQGLQLLDGEGRVVGPYISWQDQRANEALADGRSYLEAMAERGGARCGRSAGLCGGGVSIGVGLYGADAVLAAGDRTIAGGGSGDDGAGVCGGATDGHATAH